MQTTLVANAPLKQAKNIIIASIGWDIGDVDRLGKYFHSDKLESGGLIWIRKV